MACNFGPSRWSSFGFQNLCCNTKSSHIFLHCIHPHSVYSGSIQLSCLSHASGELHTISVCSTSRSSLDRRDNHITFAYGIRNPPLEIRFVINNRELVQIPRHQLGSTLSETSNLSKIEFHHSIALAISTLSSSSEVTFVQGSRRHIHPLCGYHHCLSSDPQLPSS